MKWSEYNEQAAERVAGWLSRGVGVRILYVLMILSAFLFMSGAGDKWT